MAAEGEFPKSPGDMLHASEVNGLVPIGSVIAWLKTYTNTPALPNNFVECDGSVLDDGDSVYDTQTLPDLNGDNRFMRGDATSGGTGGSNTMAHTHTVPMVADVEGGFTWAGAANNPTTTSAASNTENRPPFYNVVWIMRIK